MHKFEKAFTQREIEFHREESILKSNAKKDANIVGAIHKEKKASIVL